MTTGKNLKKVHNKTVDKNRAEIHTGTTIVTLEQVMQTCGYKFREIVQIANRPIQVYEKPQNSKYVLDTARVTALSSLQDCVVDLSTELNKNLILIDGFDKDHLKRREWMDTFELSDSPDAVIYKELNKQSKLSNKRVHALSSILQFTESQIKDPNMISIFKRNYADFDKFIRSKSYNDLSLSEKVLYMEEVDKKVMEILDLLKRIENLQACCSN